MVNSGKIMCPTITVWIIFMVNFTLYYYGIIDFNYGILHEKTDGSFWFLFFSLIIISLIELIASILVTISLETKNQCLYLIGLIMILIFDVLFTIYIIMIGIKSYDNIDNIDNFNNIKSYKEYPKNGIFIFNIIVQILIEWSQFGVLIAYFNKVKLSFNQSYLNPGFITGLPNQMLPSETAEEPI